MRSRCMYYIGVITLLLSACSQSDTRQNAAVIVDSTNESGDQSIDMAGLPTQFLYASLENGARHWKRCQACHTRHEGGRHRVGPNLYNVFGRTVGTAEGYRYSKALQDADFVWTPQALDAWLESPRGFLPGNRMSFVGLRKETDRKDLIKFLYAETHPQIHNANDDEKAYPLPPIP